MWKKVRVATSSLATFEDVKPPYNLRHPEPQENLDRGLALLDVAGSEKADIALLPETFTAAGLPYERGTLTSIAEPIPGPTFDALADQARRYRMYVVAGLPVRQESGHIENAAVIVDRTGHLLGTYSKAHPTAGEIDSGVVAGSTTCVVQTDFGRVGLAICFDLNWPSLWNEMARRRADIVCWLSAYPGGLPLRAYAFQHRYRIATSVWSYEARIIDFTGKILSETTRWDRLVVTEVDFDKRLFHTDGQYEKLLPIRAKYGQQLRVETFHEEHLFTLESRDPSLSVETVIQDFDLIEYSDYIAACSLAQERNRADWQNIDK